MSFRCCWWPLPLLRLCDDVGTQHLSFSTNLRSVCGCIPTQSLLVVVAPVCCGGPQGLEFVWRLVLEVEESAVAEASISLLTRLHYCLGSGTELDLGAILR